MHIYQEVNQIGSYMYILNGKIFQSTRVEEFELPMLTFIYLNLAYSRHDTLQSHLEHPSKCRFSVVFFQHKTRADDRMWWCYGQICFNALSTFLFKYLIDQELNQRYNIKICSKVYDRIICIKMAKVH